MKRLAGILLLVALSATSSFSQDSIVIPKTKDFEKEYLKQIDKANTALALFINLPCSTKGQQLDDAYNNLQKEVDTANLYITNIPDDQDPIVEVREIELGYGFIYTANKMTVDKIKSCSSNPSNDSDSNNSTAARMKE